MSENTSKTLDFVLALCYILYIDEEKEKKLSLTKGNKVTLTKEEWNFQFFEIEKWLSSKGYEVLQEPDVEDSIMWETKTVHINSRKHSESKYYTLLHESGHLLIANGMKQWAKDVPMYAESVDERVMNSRAYGVSLIAEEIEAWKRGRRLGKRFNHYINDEKYDNTFTQCVFSYVVSVVEGC
jgi:hypothetical protein